MLAFNYFEGSREEENVKKGIKLLEKAATLGDHYSQYKIAIIYALEFGVEKNLAKADEWFQKAESRNDDLVRNEFIAGLKTRPEKELTFLKTRWNLI